MSAPTRQSGTFDPWAYSSSTLLYDALELVPELQPGPFAIQTYSRMRRDSRLAEAISGYTLQLRRASWQVEPGDCRPEVVQLVADDMGVPVAGKDKPTAARTRGVSWNKHLRSALLMLTYGHMAFEMWADLSTGQARLAGLAERMPYTIAHIHQDPKSGELLGISQDQPRRDDKPQIAASQLAFYVNDPEATLFGTSILRACYAPWFLKQELMRVHAVSGKRFGMGVPTIEWDKDANPTPTQMQQAQQVASAARVAEHAGASLPPGARMILRGLSGSVPDVLGYIRYLDQQMAGAVLMPHIELGTTPHGSRAVADAFLDSWTLSLGAIGEDVADVATREIAARLVAWNWGTDEQVPRIVASGIGTQREATAEALQLLVASGALTADPGLEAWIRREYRLPEREGAALPAPSVRGDTVTAANPANRRRTKTVKPEPANGQMPLPLGGDS